MKDIKRRDTDHYLLCTAGKDGLLMWDLNPYTGEFTPFRLAGDAKATITRTVTAVCFSDDRELVYGATTSGDFLVASMRSQRIMQTIQATKLGLDAIVEGIETEEQRSLLLELGYKQGQGYLFGKPMLLEDLDTTQTMARSVN